MERETSERGQQMQVVVAGGSLICLEILKQVMRVGLGMHMTLCKESRSEINVEAHATKFTYLNFRLTASRGY